MNIDDRLNAAFEDLERRVTEELAADMSAPDAPLANRQERRLGPTLGRVAAALALLLLVGGPLWLFVNDDPIPAGPGVTDAPLTPGPELTTSPTSTPDTTSPETTIAQPGAPTPTDPSASSTSLPFAGEVITLDAAGSFTSPSGNIACSMSATGGVTCFIGDKDWEVRRPPGCEFDWGNVIDLGPGGVTWGCYSDVFWDQTVGALAYGDAMVVGPYRCDSARAGVTCRDDLGQSFTLSRAAVTIVPPPTTDSVLFLTLSPDGLGGALSFGADGDAVAAEVNAAYGPPTDTRQLELVPVTNPSAGFAWGDADDGLGQLSKFPYVRHTCWIDLCLTDVSSDAANWLFSGWEHGMLDSGDTYLTLTTPAGLAVGDSYGRLLDLYPGATISAGEGGSVGFQLPGWPQVADGAVVGNGRLGITLSPFDPALVPADTPIQSIFSSDGSTSFGCC